MPRWLAGLLGQIADPVASVTADGDYDQGRVYQAVTEHHPAAADRQADMWLNGAIEPG